MTYNMESYLAQCIDSILKQEVDFTYEVLVADDCSSDNSREIIREYDKKYPGLVKAIYNPVNLGVSRNLCNLIKQANGDFIIQIDGDDFLTDNSKFQLQVNFLNNNPEFSICFHNMVFVDADGNNSRVHVQSFSGDCELPSNYLPENLLGGCHCVMIRRSALPKPLPEWLPNSGYQIDYLIQCLAAAEGKIYYFDVAMAAYRKHPTSITKTTQQKIGLEMMTFNVENLSNFYKNKRSNHAAGFLRSLLPDRYMILGYFYLSEGDVLYFIRYFFKGFFMRPNFKLRSHKDMIYTASPTLAKKIKKMLSLKISL